MLDETIAFLTDLRFNIINRNPNNDFDEYTQKLLDNSSIHLRKLLKLRDEIRKHENRRSKITDLLNQNTFEAREKARISK